MDMTCEEAILPYIVCVRFGLKRPITAIYPDSGSLRKPFGMSFKSSIRLRDVLANAEMLPAVLVARNSIPVAQLNIGSEEQTN